MKARKRQKGNALEEFFSDNESTGMVLNDELEQLEPGTSWHGPKVDGGLLVHLYRRLSDGELFLFLLGPDAESWYRVVRHTRAVDVERVEP